MLVVVWVVIGLVLRDVLVGEMSFVFYCREIVFGRIVVFK